MKESMLTEKQKLHAESTGIYDSSWLKREALFGGDNKISLLISSSPDVIYERSIRISINAFILYEQTEWRDK